jgi:hypothetical protein
MKKFLALAAVTAAAIAGGSVFAQPKGVNVGTLSCTVAGGVGFIFGSSKEMSCILSRTDGRAERYLGTVNKYGVDIGFTKEAHMVWLVFAPGDIAKGAIAGQYVGATASATAGVGVGANVLVGGSNRSVTLQPVSVEGNVGLNVAAGIGDINLRAIP